VCLSLVRRDWWRVTNQVLDPKASGWHGGHSRSNFSRNRYLSSRYLVLVTKLCRNETVSSLSICLQYCLVDTKHHTKLTSPSATPSRFQVHVTSRVRSLRSLSVLFSKSWLLVEDALEEIRQDGVERVVAFTQYPQVGSISFRSSASPSSRQYALLFACSILARPLALVSIALQSYCKSGMHGMQACAGV
jgi:hypothetical protein